MTSIATYHEKRFDGQRIFDLLADRIIVKSKKQLGPEFEEIVMLHTLQPIANKMRARPRGFGEGLWMIVGSVILLQSGIVGPLSYYGGLIIVMGISGLLLSVATAGKVEWAFINSKAGVPALSVARAGPGKKAFEPFVQSILKQIQIVEHYSDPVPGQT